METNEIVIRVTFTSAESSILESKGWTRMRRTTWTPEKTALFLFGVFFVVIMLTIAIAIPSPTEIQWKVFNLVLALIAGAFGAILPGVLKIRFQGAFGGKEKKRQPFLVAGGAIGMFVLVFFGKPASFVSSDPILPPPPPIEAAQPVLSRFLGLMDSGRYEDAYDFTSVEYRQQYRRDDYIALSRSMREPLGKTVKRTLAGQFSDKKTSGLRGHYRLYTYTTQFENAPKVIQEHVTIFALDPTLGWQASGYQFNP